MKQLLLVALFTIVCLSMVQAQKPITLAADSVKIGNTLFPGFWLTIPESKPDAIKSSWSKAILKGTKSKISTNNNEMTLFGAIISDFYDGNVNIMSKIEDQDTSTRLFVCVETTRDNFIGKSSSEYEKLSRYLKKYARDQYVIVAKDQLAAEEDKLSDLEKELKSMRKSKEKMEKDIQSAKVRITGENDNISALNKEIIVVDANISNVSSVLSYTEEGEAKKAKQSELKTLQKKKKGILKDINSAENSISKANTDIADNTRDIELNEVNQAEINEKIKQQAITIVKFQKKLKTIEAF